MSGCNCNVNSKSDRRINSRMSDWEERQGCGHVYEERKDDERVIIGQCSHSSTGGGEEM